MPLKLKEPRPGKTPCYYVRGTYLGQHVNESTGTGEVRVARQALRKIKEAIERGTFARDQGPTFADAAMSYMLAGGERTFLPLLLEHFKERPLSSIDQAAIDAAAGELYPIASNATRNRQVYTPVSAILKRAGIHIPLKRPKGALGEKRTDWLSPAQAFRLFKEAEEIDWRFAVLLRFLTYTGCRLSEALNLEWKNVSLEEGTAFFPKTKPGTARTVFLPSHIQSRLRRLAAPDGERPQSGRWPVGDSVFRLTKGGRLYNLLGDTKRAADLPGVRFHTLRHTWATWMRKYGKVDTRGLIATGAWNDSQAAERYQHVVVAEEAKKAALLPVEKAWKRKSDRPKKPGKKPKSGVKSKPNDGAAGQD